MATTKRAKDTLDAGLEMNNQNDQTPLESRSEFTAMPDNALIKNEVLDNVIGPPATPELRCDRCGAKFVSQDDLANHAKSCKGIG